MDKKYLLGAAILIAAAVGVWIYFKRKGEKDQDEANKIEGTQKELDKGKKPPFLSNTKIVTEGNKKFFVTLNPDGSIKSKNEIKNQSGPAWVPGRDGIGPAGPRKFVPVKQSPIKTGGLKTAPPLIPTKKTGPVKQNPLVSTNKTSPVKSNPLTSPIRKGGIIGNWLRNRRGRLTFE